MLRINSDIVALVSVLILCGAFDAPAGAQQYPTRPIRLIVPLSPGGGVDIVGRIIALRLSDALAQPVVVDNRSGAGSTIGTDLAAKARPDGYTMLINGHSLAVNATLFPKLPYDTLKDLAPITLVGRQPSILVVHPSVPARSVRELLALARAKPGQLNYGSGGVGTVTFLSAELFKLLTKVDIVHVPYKGLGPALTDLIGGQIQLIISTMASALPQVKAGKLRALAITTAKRSLIFPELPTVDEAGVPGYEFSTWYGLLVTAGTPRPIIARVNQAMAGVLESAALKELFIAQGIDPLHTSPEEFASYLKAEVEKWARVIKASGVTPE